MTAELNLASRPFRNERLPSLAVGGLVLMAVIASALHARELTLLHAAPARERRAEIARLEAELQGLRERQAAVAVPDVPKALQARWAAARDIVDRRVFSFTLLLSRLEAALPRDVRLLSVAPGSARHPVVVAVEAEAESVEAGFALVARLEARPEFAEVRPAAINDAEAGRVEMQYRMRYLPAAALQADRSAAPASAAAAEARP